MPKRTRDGDDVLRCNGDEHEKRHDVNECHLVQTKHRIVVNEPQDCSKWNERSIDANY